MSKIKEAKTYKFEVCLNPYNPNAIMRIMKFNDNKEEIIDYAKRWCFNISECISAN